MCVDGCSVCMYVSLLWVHCTSLEAYILHSRLGSVCVSVCVCLCLCVCVFELCVLQLYRKLINYIVMLVMV